MKKLMRKLVLSSFALGLAVITLSTTTFAWYTANQTVGVTDIKGSSSASGDSLLMISLTGNDGDFHNTVKSEIDVTTLLPVQYNHNASGSPEFNKLAESDSTNASDVNTKAGTQYIMEELYFRGVETTGSGEAGVKVFLKSLTLENKTPSADWKTKDVLTTEGLPGWDLNSKKAYKVDILRTINIAFAVYTGAPNGDTSKPGYKYTHVKTFVLNPEGLLTISDDLSDIANFNAHEYFNAVTGRTIATEDKLQPKDNPETTDVDESVLDYVRNVTHGSEILFGKTPDSLSTYNALKVEVYIFINGWDLACFDAVQGQQISLGMEFSSVDATTIA